MRPSLLNKVQSAICVKCKLPNGAENIDKTLLTTDEDYCLENQKSEELSQIIYNGIVEYAVNEFKIDYSNLSLEQTKVIVRDMKYDSSAATSEKLKYGFYGEVLLDLILRTYFSTNVLLQEDICILRLKIVKLKGLMHFI